MSLGDRDSYYENFETTNLTKGKKGKTEYTYSNDMPASFKNRTENTHNGVVVGQKKLIANSYGNNNTPAKVLCCQNPLK